MKKGKSKRSGLIATMCRVGPRLAVCGIGLGAGYEATGTTLITFEGFQADNLSIAGLPDYGDNVSASSADYTVSAGLSGVVGTPDITLDWIGQWDTYTNWDAVRGSVAQSDFNGGQIVSIFFNPSPISAVRLVSFELDEWSGGGAGSITWDVSRPAGGVVATGTFTMSNAGGRSLISPNVIGALGETLTLNLTLNSGLPSYFALDNLTMDQVPEPSALALGAAVLGAATMRRRRQA